MEKLQYDEMKKTWYQIARYQEKPMDVNFELEIYNRWGKHLWSGNQDKLDWDGTVPEGIGNQKAAPGTYYYILYLNDPDYPEPLTGYLYINY